MIGSEDPLPSLVELSETGPPRLHLRCCFDDGGNLAPAPRGNGGQSDNSQRDGNESQSVMYLPTGKEKEDGRSQLGIRRREEGLEGGSISPPP